ncbi:MAG: hypothetical protein K0V04_10115 [Deltaproteobacteria bacterium]|nr:hypothetical protein [Deltaproteobacteria bacterium]
MKRWWAGASRSTLLAGLVAGLVAVPGCDDGSSSETGEGSESSGDDGVGWFEIGWGQDSYVAISDGDDFPVVRGGQGSEMFPMPLQGAEFYLPGNPTSWMDADAPLVDLEMDVEGFNDGPGGHFKRIANYALDWVIREDGTYESAFLPILMPDGIDTEQLDGLPAHIHVQLRPFDQPMLVRELDVIIRAAP